MTRPRHESFRTSKTHGPGRTRGIREIRAEGSHLNRQVLLPAERFIYSETIGGALLVVCAIVALAWANSRWSQSYFALRDAPVSFQIGTFSLALDLQVSLFITGLAFSETRGSKPDEKKGGGI